MRIYIDSGYRCHLTGDSSMRAVETSFFDGKCAAFVEGYRFIPAGEAWVRPDSEVFHGEVVFPAEDYAGLAKTQAQHEADEEAHLAELGALIEEIYNEDLEVIDDV